MYDNKRDSDNYLNMRRNIRQQNDMEMDNGGNTGDSRKDSAGKEKNQSETERKTESVDTTKSEVSKTESQGISQNQGGETEVKKNAVNTGNYTKEDSIIQSDKDVLSVDLLDAVGKVVKSYKPEKTDGYVIQIGEEINPGVFSLRLNYADNTSTISKVIKLPGVNLDLKLVVKPAGTGGSLLKLFQDNKEDYKSIPHADIKSTNEFKDYKDAAFEWKFDDDKALLACFLLMSYYKKGIYGFEPVHDAAKDVLGTGSEKNAPEDVPDFWKTNDTYTDGATSIKDIHFWVRVPKGGNVEDYVVVQWLKGYAKNAAGAYFHHRNYGVLTPVNYADFVIDSLDTDPIYKGSAPSIGRWCGSKTGNDAFFVRDSPIQSPSASAGNEAKLEFKTQLFLLKDVPEITAGNLGGAEAKALKTLTWSYITKVNADGTFKHDF